MTWLRGRFHAVADHGGTAAEYCLLVSLIAGVIIAIVITFGVEVTALFEAVPIPFP
jgi:Flp pilus assembly pilin Flp